MTYQHKNLAAGDWHKLSLAQQLGNIGSEISRAKNWQNKDEDRFEGAFIRALELIDLTLMDSRWKNRLKELARIREVVCDAYLGGKEYNSNFEDLLPYFDRFALVARSGV